MHLPGEIAPPDITGFEQAVSELVLRDATLSPNDVQRHMEMLDSFAKHFRSLDDFKRRNTRVRQFYGGEPVFHKGMPGIVLSIGITMVFIRKFFVPVDRPSSPVIAKTLRCKCHDVSKIDSPNKWQQWMGGMYQCGHDASHWTTHEIWQAGHQLGDDEQEAAE